MEVLRNPIQLLVLAFMLWRSDGLHPKGSVSKAPPSRATLSNTSEAAIRRAVPSGTPVDEAKTILKDIGFTCRPYKNEGEERLWCRVDIPTGFEVGQRRLVTFLVKNGKVFHMTFTEGGIGP